MVDRSWWQFHRSEGFLRSCDLETNLERKLCTKKLECSRPGLTMDNLPIQPGNYRHNVNSEVVHTCLIEEACPGGNRTGDALCAYGYEGPLCAVCSVGFTTSTVSGLCRECDAMLSPEEFHYMFMICGFMALFAVVMRVRRVFMCCGSATYWLLSRLDLSKFKVIFIVCLRHLQPLAISERRDAVV